MTEELKIETIRLEELVDRAQAMKAKGCRLVQISATRLPESIELTYSFDLAGQLSNLRLQLPSAGTRVPSISPIFWCAFLYENEMHDLFDLSFDNLAVDFHGNLYRTAVKHPFGTAPASQGKPPATSAPQATAQPATCARN